MMSSFQLLKNCHAGLDVLGALSMTSLADYLLYQIILNCWSYILIIHYFCQNEAHDISVLLVK